MVLIYDADTGEFETLDWRPGHEAVPRLAEVGSESVFEATMVRTRKPRPGDTAAEMPLSLVDCDVEAFLEPN